MTGRLRACGSRKFVVRMFGPGCDERFVGAFGPVVSPTDAKTFAGARAEKVAADWRACLVEWGLQEKIIIDLCGASLYGVG